MPRITVRVVCGLSEVIATFVPTSALVSVDLPALGRPTNDANPLLCSLAHGRSVGRRLVVRGPDLLVGLPPGLARAVDRARVDSARLAGGRRAPVAHDVVRRGGQPPVAHQVLADRPHLRGLPRHPEVAGRPGQSRPATTSASLGVEPGHVGPRRAGSRRSSASGTSAQIRVGQLDRLGDPGHRGHRGQVADQHQPVRVVRQRERPLRLGDDDRVAEQSPETHSVTRPTSWSTTSSTSSPSASGAPCSSGPGTARAPPARPTRRGRRSRRTRRRPVASAATRCGRRAAR